VTAAIEVDAVSKRFRLSNEKHQSLKERLIHLGRSSYDDFWALRDVSFDVEQGETIGLLGHNGSGKSTLLKCVAGILRPTAGEIRTRGRVASMLELGAGFHPDLTGRENVFLNGALLGLADEEIAARFDDIVAFAELEAFIDQQVKHYSSGMYVRLGFAVAVHMEPDVLLVDEVLAVGDEAFQAKCLGRIKQFQREGRTIVIVTHDAELVPRVCDRAVVLSHGDVVTIGSPGEAVVSLRGTLYALGEAPAPGPSEPVAPGRPAVIEALELRFPADPSRGYLGAGEPLAVDVGFRTRERLDDVVVSLALYDAEGRQLFGTSTEIARVELGAVEGGAVAHFDFSALHLLAGVYFVSAKLSTSGGLVYDWWQQRGRLEVMHAGREVGVVHHDVAVTIEREQAHEEAAG
jgi:ABC-2 type transport system ATP-binding protein